MSVVEEQSVEIYEAAGAAAATAAAGSAPGAAGAATATATALAEGAACTPWTPRIVAFACHWCTYSGADLAGLNRMNYPANVKLLRVPCSGRVNPQYVLTALHKGCDGVLVCGCHPGDCHYATGNYFAKRRLMAFRRLLEFSGLEPERFQVRWISGSEAGKFRDTVISVCEQIRTLGPLTPDECWALEQQKLDGELLECGTEEFCARVGTDTGASAVASKGGGVA